MTDFLAALEPADRDALLALGTRRRYPAGVTITHEHDEVGSVLVVLDGQVTASTLGAEGHEVLFGVAGPGQIVGELAALRGAPRSATLRARTDVTAQVVRAADFRRFLQTVPKAAMAVLDTVIDRLEVADGMRREMASLDVVARVARRLVDLGERFGAARADGGVEVSVTHEELAAWTGASRESVTKGLHVLRTLGCVATHRGHITVLDQAKLRRRAALDAP
jgi:CRP/FNR family transcriptional regulator, cyclic AMP receptor protein